MTDQHPEQMSLRPRPSGDLQAPQQHPPALPLPLPIPSLGQTATGSHGMLQRLLSQLTGGASDARGLQLSITTSQQREAGAGAQPSPAPDLPLSPTALDGVGLAAAEPPLASELSGEAAEGRAADAAAQHRLSTSVLDIRQLASGIEKGLPFVALLLMLFVYRHLVGILCFGWLTYVLHRLNRVVRAQVALKAQLQARALLGVAGVVAVQLPLICLATWQQRVWRSLLLLPVEPPLTEFWDVLFAVVVADACVRYIAVLAKVLVLLAVKVDGSALVRRRGHVLTALDYCAALYRGLVPVPLWYRWFKNLPGLPAFLCTACSGLYILLKCTTIYERLAAAGVAVRQAAQHSAYGCAPTQEEVAEAGNACPICQDNLRGPIKLHCGHIYCADCIDEWFERDAGSTCPMCRTPVRPVNIKSHSDGYTTLLPNIF